jgi:peptide-methionine (R)-S-oxide reductase
MASNDKKQLSPLEMQVCWNKGTEAPFSGKYWDHFEKGNYHCINCHQQLFSSEQKFDAGCGWPSFDNELGEGRIKQEFDESHGMRRTEISCSHCGVHLGHIFDDGPGPSQLRYCVNSASLNFEEEEDLS